MPGFLLWEVTGRRLFPKEVTMILSTEFRQIVIIKEENQQQSSRTMLIVPFYSY